MERTEIVQWTQVGADNNTAFAGISGWDGFTALAFMD
jgi:hypothetical protein